MKRVQDLKAGEVIHCSTKEQSDAICKLMHEAGLKWCSGSTYMEKDEFNDYKGETCYEPASGTYCNLNYFTGQGSTIYEAKDFLEKDLLQEAKERGFVIGAKFISPTDKREEVQIVETEPYFYLGTEGIAVRNYKGVIYYEGEWATLIEDTKETEMEDKEIIGYKLKEEFKNNDRIKNAIITITGIRSFERLNLYLQKESWGGFKLRLEEAGVLDLWFEPVYEEVKRVKLPKINGYQGEDVGSNLKWGCFEIKKADVHHLINLKLKSFTIQASDETAEVTEEQFNQIKKYLQ